MLWYKSWLETRWRFLIGFVLLVCSTAGVVFTYPQVMKLMPLVPKMDIGGELGRRVREAAELSRDFRGFVWLQGFRQNLSQMITLFAVLLGTGGLLSQSAGGNLFTLSMPISRRDLIGVRAAAGLSELLVLAAVPAVLIPLLAPAIGESYSVGGSLVHALCLFMAATVFFSLAFLLSTIFMDVWRPLLIALAIAFVVGISEQLFHDFSRYGIFGLMSGEIYFRNGSVPWAGFFASAVLSAVMLYGAAANFERRDF